MLKDKLSQNKEVQLKDMENYYRFQAKIYDWTRWVFLFGRKSILYKLPFERNASLSILDVGCGTGSNSLMLAKYYPNAQIIGLDVSADMLTRARQKLEKFKDRVDFLHKPYDQSTDYHNRFDLILFSYSLTMINPQWSELIEQSRLDLKEGGAVAVVDFHDTKVPFYKRFMRSNHVRLDGQLLPVLQKTFKTHFAKVKKGYLGIWEYLQYVGIKA